MLTGVATKREIERKYVLPDGAALPSFRGLDGVRTVTRPVEHHLLATYYDTADGRLAAGGVALRRRAGGEDEGWHLKEDGPDGSRLETHAPLGGGDDDVPEELAALVRSRARRRALVAIATIENRRIVRKLLGAGRRVLAEVVDDRVSAVALGDGAAGPSAWREIEVELVDGDHDLLGLAEVRLTEVGAVSAGWSSKLGRAVGAPARSAPPPLGSRSTAGEVVHAHLTEQIERLVSLDPLVRQDEHDAVHKMRVATRRLRSALATFRRELDRDVTDPRRDELKWLAGVLGAARDAEVIHARLHELVAEEPADLVRGPVVLRIDDTMGDRRRRAHDDVVAALDSDRYLALLDALDAVAAGDPITGRRAGKRAAKALPGDVRRSWDRWQREVEALDDGGTRHDEHLHEVRKAAKRVRYAAEAVEPVIGADAEALAERMEELQEVLGAHQDGMVIDAVILDVATAARVAGEDTFTYGRLHAREQQRSDSAASGGEALVAALSRKPPKWLR